MYEFCVLSRLLPFLSIEHCLIHQKYSSIAPYYSACQYQTIPGPGILHRIYCIYHIYQLGTYIHAISVLKECLLYTKYLYSENVYNQGMYYFIMF